METSAPRGLMRHSTMRTWLRDHNTSIMAAGECPACLKPSNYDLGMINGGALGQSTKWLMQTLCLLSSDTRMQWVRGIL